MRGLLSQLKKYLCYDIFSCRFGCVRFNTVALNRGHCEELSEDSGIAYNDDVRGINAFVLVPIENYL